MAGLYLQTHDRAMTAKPTTQAATAQSRQGAKNQADKDRLAQALRKNLLRRKAAAAGRESA